MLKRFLLQETRQHQAQALLRLGQAELARGRLRDSIATLEECIEFHQHDAASYQARLVCANAYGELQQFERAEKLLRTNLSRTALTPRSPEWRQSLFALGHLLHNRADYENDALVRQDLYDEAIRILEEALERTALSKVDPTTATLTAQYVVAEAYRNAAHEPLRRLSESKTESERQKNRKLVNDYLSGALANYERVQKQISSSGSHATGGALERAILRNCYMFRGAVLYDLKRYKEAIEAFSNVSTLYQHEPFVLETFLQISHCWQRLNKPSQARGVIEQAKIVLGRLPADADFRQSTNFSRAEWERILEQLSPAQNNGV